MYYVISDIHGNYKKYCELLDCINLKDEDVLYVLGDVIDRGEQGIRILQDMMFRINVVPMIGKHDLIGWRCLKWLTQEITEESIDNMDTKMLQIIEEWCKSGGQTTINEVMALPKEEREEILEYLEEFRAYEEVRVGGNTFLLVHGGFE